MAMQVVQAVQAVHLESDAFLVCLNHALSTEKEEVMGLCIGEVDTVRIVHIHSVIILRRSDKRKDRVEISPEQLSAASTEAERLAELTGRPMRVVGWYHSHPHITVWPSHVDVRTQAMYQMMDQGFVGLIFSCFIEDKNTKTGRVLYTCFQSIQAQKSSEYERIEIPIHIVPHVTIGKVCLESAVELPKILCQEEQDAYRRIHSLTHLDSVTKIHNGSGFPLAYGSRDVHDGLRRGIFAQPFCLSSGWPYTTVRQSNLLRFSYFLLQPHLSPCSQLGGHWCWRVFSSVFFLLKCLPRICAARCQRSAGLSYSGWRTDWSKTSSICRSCNKKRRS
ncbi:lys-63-specific deubiquitinase BRCC36 isoform X2 [Rousettus aegyptiacus]|uniref:lys-63-specific deubiquitinase BRCC36 isoform X2 n=1 Tax=Rousettus aegyptiacus TaxID=9407 RepID=UPI0007894691|nr:lys-63-specific deubiquitinase BRCC36 isoform X2 [Rousettus aegyptiacus]